MDLEAVGTQEPNMNIANWLDEAGLRYPKRPALFEGRQLVANYGAFVALVRHRAAYLIDEHGIAPATGSPCSCRTVANTSSCSTPSGGPVPWQCRSTASCTRRAGWIVGNADARLIFTDGGQVFAPRDCPGLPRTGSRGHGRTHLAHLAAGHALSASGR
ncbi:hypothetical protein QNM99_07555 [Pseudomonas sp. PCH446]